MCKRNFPQLLISYLNADYTSLASSYHHSFHTALVTNSGSTDSTEGNESLTRPTAELLANTDYCELFQCMYDME